MQLLGGHDGGALLCVPLFKGQFLAVFWGNRHGPKRHRTSGSRHGHISIRKRRDEQNMLRMKPGEYSARPLNPGTYKGSRRAKVQDRRTPERSVEVGKEVRLDVSLGLWRRRLGYRLPS